jgi:hypothetical protein
MRKKVNEEAMLEQRAKEEALKNEALGFYRQLRERGLKPFDGASIDFHRKRDPVVFIPGEKPVITTVKKEELLDFLVKNNVRRVLVDALFPSRAELLMEVSKAGIEVYFIRRLTVITKFRKFLKKKLKIEVPKNDFTDAVLQAFIKEKYLQRIDWRYLDCLLEMQLWRDSGINYQKYRQRLKTFPKEKRNRVAKLVTDIEENARIFVDTVLKYYPEVADLFKKLKIEDDIISQAHACEVFLEVLPCDTLIGAINKAGIKLSERASEKKLIHDGRFSHALNQLTLRIYHLNPKSEKVIEAELRLVRKIWKFSRKLQMRREGGRVGEALERVRPESRDSGRPDLPKGRVLRDFTPAFRAGDLRKAGVCQISPGPDPRP